MAKFIRYALASVFFGASVGCLALWLFGVISQIGYYSTTWNVTLDTDGEYAWLDIGRLPPFPRGIWIIHPRMSEPAIDEEWRDGDVFGQDDFGAVFFPLWYPALVFALAGVATLRFRRQFTIRAALIAVTIVAALLGMAAAL